MPQGFTVTTEQINERVELIDRDTGRVAIVRVIRGGRKPRLRFEGADWLVVTADSKRQPEPQP